MHMGGSTVMYVHVDYCKFIQIFLSQLIPPIQLSLHRRMLSKSVFCLGTWLFCNNLPATAFVLRPYIASIMAL